MVLRPVLLPVLRPALMPLFDRIRRSAAVFSPLSNFSSGQLGAWYDPSTFTGLYQDSAGTSPATAVGQPDGLMLDKRLGLVRGMELVSNGDFNTDTAGWTPVAGITQTWVAGEIKLTTNGSGYTSDSLAIQLVSGKSYEISASIRPFTAAGSPTNLGRIQLQGALSGFLEPGGALKRIMTASGSNLVLALGVASSGVLAESGGYCFFDNISVKELPGNHISQATASARPIINAAGGIQYLTFDGLDDGLSTGPITLGSDMDCFVAIRRSTSSQMILLSATTGGGNYIGVIQSGSSESTENGAGSPSYAVDGVLVNAGATSVTRGQLHTALPSNVWHVLEIRNINVLSWPSISFGGYGGWALNGDFGGIILCPAGDATTRQKNRQYLGNKVGLTLP